MSVDGLFVENWFLTFVRALSVVTVAPVLSMGPLPALAKVGLGAIMAYVLTMARSAQLTPLSGQLGPFLMAIAQEMLVGLLIGFAAALVFTAFRIAGETVGISLGFRLGAVLNPALPLQGGAAAQFYATLATLLFLAIRGHHLVLLSLERTLDVVPLGTFAFEGDMIERLIRISSTSITAGVQMALPILGAVLLTDMALGLVNRAMPQMSVFIVGLPLKVMVGITVLLLALPATMRAAGDLVNQSGQAGLILLGR